MQNSVAVQTTVRKKLDIKKQKWLIIIPPALFLTVFMLYPMLSMLKLSFTDANTNEFTYF